MTLALRLRRSGSVPEVARPHLLYIAFFYPPSRSSGVYRAHATVNSFVRKGWDVTVVTPDDGFFDRATGSSDWSLVNDIPDVVDVVRVPFDLAATRGVDLRKFGWFAGNFHWLNFRIKKLGRRTRKAREVLAGQDALGFEFVDRYVGWIDPVVKAGLRTSRSKPIGAILATGNPFSSFEAARLLGRVLDVPYAIDYRDPWALNVRTGEVLERTAGTVEAERRIVTEAGFAVFVNSATVDLYTEIYPELTDKCHVFFNGFDEASLSSDVVPVVDPLRFGMLGTATDLWPLEEFFEAWRRTRSELGDNPSVALGGYLGYFAWSASPLEDLFPTREEGFQYLGPVPKMEVGSFYDSVDVIVVLLFGGPIITAGKMYETMAQGKPILCVQPPDGGARKVFEEHPYAVCVDPDPDAIVDGLKRVAELARSTTVEHREQVRSDMRRYERLTELDRLVDRVAEMIGDAR